MNFMIGHSVQCPVDWWFEEKDICRSSTTIVPYCDVNNYMVSLAYDDCIDACIHSKYVHINR